MGTLAVGSVNAKVPRPGTVTDVENCPNVFGTTACGTEIWNVYGPKVGRAGTGVGVGIGVAVAAATGMRVALPLGIALGEIVASRPGGNEGAGEAVTRCAAPAATFGSTLGEETAELEEPPPQPEKIIVASTLKEIERRMVFSPQATPAALRYTNIKRNPAVAGSVW